MGYFFPFRSVLGLYPFYDGFNDWVLVLGFFDVKILGMGINIGQIILGGTLSSRSYSRARGLIFLFCFITVFAVKGTGSPGEGISIAVRSAGSMLHFKFVL